MSIPLTEHQRKQEKEKKKRQKDIDLIFGQKETVNIKETLKNNIEENQSIMLDANLKPNYATFLFEADIEKYMRMTETIEAIFEALPMCILQYINNESNNIILCAKEGTTYLQDCTANVN